MFVAACAVPIPVVSGQLDPRTWHSNSTATPKRWCRFAAAFRAVAVSLSAKLWEQAVAEEIHGASSDRTPLLCKKRRFKPTGLGVTGMDRHVTLHMWRVRSIQGAAEAVMAVPHPPCP